MTSMLSVLTDPEIRRGRVFLYRGFDATATKHPYTDEPIPDPWSDRFPPGRSAAMVLEPSETGRVRFMMVNMDNDDHDIWAGRANAARCLVDPGCIRLPLSRPYPDDTLTACGEYVARLLQENLDA